MMFKFKT